jgi:HAE1 family hydrophobic/amphiphilic exporter-1
VSVLVSLIVSFSLTPMMCARLLRTEDAASGHVAEGDHAGSRGGFYAWIDGAYAWSLALSMRHRWVIVVISVLTLASAVPIYRQVKQEYIPSDVDESEFEVLVFGPREDEPRRDGRGDAGARQGGAARRRAWRSPWRRAAGASWAR